jgi:hypothetical protein
MQKKTKNIDSPAFPPQLMQDNFGQVVALVPGLTKLEYAAIKFFPMAYNIEKPLKYRGKDVTKYQAAIIWARELLEEIEKQNKVEEDNLQIIQ